MNRNNSSQASTPNKEKHKKYLVATFTKIGSQRKLIGPNESNWDKTPFICGNDACEDLDQVYSIKMKRLKSVQKNAKHMFADLNFISADSTTNQVRTRFLHNNLYLFKQKTCFEKGLFEEVRIVKDTKIQKNSDSKVMMGYIVLGYKAISDVYDEDGVTLNWKTWSNINLLCSSLPVPSTFCKIGFYREISHTSSYKFLLLFQVNGLMTYLTPALNYLNNVKTQINAYIEIYREIDFKLDSEVLTVMGDIESIASNGYGLSLRIQPSPKKAELRRRRQRYLHELRHPATAASSSSSSVNSFLQNELNQPFHHYGYINHAADTSPIHVGPNGRILTKSTNYCRDMNRNILDYSSHLMDKNCADNEDKLNLSCYGTFVTDHSGFNGNCYKYNTADADQINKNKDDHSNANNNNNNNAIQFVANDDSYINAKFVRRKPEELLKNTQSLKRDYPIDNFYASKHFYRY